MAPNELVDLTMGKLVEIRRRIILISTTLLAFSFLAYLFMPSLTGYLIRGVEGLVFLGPTEAFVARVRLSIFIGVVASFPTILWHTIRLLSPMTVTRKPLRMCTIVTVAFVLFLGGLCFAFTIVLPLVLRFFMRFATDTIVPMISVDRYVSFMILCVLPFGLSFELPVIIPSLVCAGLITTNTLSQGRKYVVLAIFILSAILTPSSDVVSQLLLALPLWALYEIGSLVARLLSRRR